MNYVIKIEFMNKCLGYHLKTVVLRSNNRNPSWAAFAVLDHHQPGISAHGVQWTTIISLGAKAKKKRSEAMFILGK